MTDLEEAGAKLTTPMAVYLNAGPRMTIMPGLTAIPVSEVELLAIEGQAARAALEAAVERVEALAFEFDDQTPRRFMVERAVAIAAIRDKP